MGHTPFGYKIENGIAVIDQPAADKLRQLYKNYLSGMSLSKAATALGRNNKQTQMRKLQIPTRFHMGEVTALYDNPVKQAEYLYSLIESESK